MNKKLEKSVKLLSVLLLMSLFSVRTINATPGRVRGNSIVNIGGVDYGQHGSDDHWHVAKKTGNGWYPVASGTEIGSLDDIKNSNTSKPGWHKKGGTWYYGNSKGVAQKGWTKVGSTWYYMNSSGAMQTGWTKVGKTWYYMNSSGAMQTGWTKVGKTWYYMTGSGAMQTGWTKVGKTWYYMTGSGAMQTGWTKVGNTWYYMTSSGAMQTGWTKVGKTWYYMNSSGHMQTGWIKVGKTWYYMSGSGAMQTGWTKINGKTYYMNSSGAMQTGKVTIGGIVYYFESSGALDKEIGDDTSDLPESVPEDTADLDMVTFNNEFLSLVNAERRRVGVPPLKYEAKLQKGANIRASELMFEYSHLRPNGEQYYTAFNYIYERPGSLISENISRTGGNEVEDINRDVKAGKTTHEKAYAKLFYDGYRTSSGHYNAMVAEYHTGLAVAAHLKHRIVDNVMIFTSEDYYLY